MLQFNIMFQITIHIAYLTQKILKMVIYDDPKNIYIYRNLFKPAIAMKAS